MRKKVFTFRMSLVATLLTALLAFPAIAQSDNFDSGTLDPAWKAANFSAGLVNLSFPDSGTGKALRMRANPVPGAAPAAAMLFRDDVYTNFYMAVDIVDWPGTDKNQAFVLVARGSLSANPATTTGMILNYDASQYGEGATSRRQGQLQINMVTNDPAFGTKTIAVAEITFQPGRSYRLIFKGEGSHYTGQAYDLTDLTAPLVTLEANDIEQGPLAGGGLIFEHGFDTGKSGILVFSREGTSGTGDFTLDNYYAGSTDPDPAPGTALAHPVAGTPTIESRIPVERFKNFHNPAQGLSFVVKTYTDNLIDAAATKLRLNGTDVSNQLALPANSSNITVTLPGSALIANMVYAGQLEVVDVSGTKRSTNLFWFDTFSDAFLSSTGVKTIEAEEYNYDNGKFQPDPIPVSGYDTNGNMVNGAGVGYLDLISIEGIDFHDARTGAEGTWSAEFRSGDPVGLAGGIFPEIEDLTTQVQKPRWSDNVRQKHSASNLLEYIVHRTEPGEWLNYTRAFEAGSFTPFLRVASFGATDVELHRVTSDPTQADQTTIKLGTFKVPNMIARYNYRYIPLVDDQGQTATVAVPAGTNTLRLQMAGTEGQDVRKIAINYLLLVPQTASAPTVKLFASPAVNGSYSEAADATIDAAARTISVPITGNARFFQVNSDTAIRILGAQVLGTTLKLTYQ